MSKVSVVVPIYNAGNTLHKCIKSILSQSLTDFELILINDGSSDNSLDICKKYELKDNRIKLINKQNEGCIASRKKGIEASTSKFILFVDADDWIHKKTIEILYKESISNNLDVAICCDYKVIGNGLIKKKNNSRFFNEDKIFNNEQIKSDLVTSYLHGHPFPAYLVAKLYKKELLLSNGKYLNRIHFLGEDLYYNLEMFLNSNKIKIINKPLYYYRSGGLTSKYMPYLLEDAINGYEIQKEIVEEHFQESKETRYNGMSVMLLNFFKTFLCNLFSGNLSEQKIKEIITMSASNKSVIDCLDNQGSIKVFDVVYLNAIRNNDVDYLFQLGQDMYKKSLPKKYLIRLLSKIA